MLYKQSLTTLRYKTLAHVFCMRCKTKWKNPLRVSILLQFLGRVEEVNAHWFKWALHIPLVIIIIIIIVVVINYYCY